MFRCWGSLFSPFSSPKVDGGCLRVGSRVSEKRWIPGTHVCGRWGFIRLSSPMRGITRGNLTCARLPVSCGPPARSACKRGASPVGDAASLGGTDGVVPAPTALSATGRRKGVAGRGRRKRGPNMRPGVRGFWHEDGRVRGREMKALARTFSSRELRDA